MKRAFFAPFLLALPSVSLLGQACNDDTVLNMWRTQNPKDDGTNIVTFVTAAGNANCNYSISGIKSLIDSGVPPKAISAMLEKAQSANPVPGSAPAKPDPPKNPPMPPADNAPAVFFRAPNGPWSPMLSESVDYTSNGKGATMRKYTTFGVKPRSLQVHAFTEGSKTSLPAQPEIVINVPPGASINNYILVRLSGKKGQRHLHLSSNKKTDLAHAGLAYTIVSSDQGKGQYKIALPNDASPGEYGIYNVNTVASDQGKMNMFTFRVLPQ